MEEPNKATEATETEEYITFTITAKDGSRVEMAVVDEFEFEKKNYLVAEVVRDDALDESGQYIYRCRMTEDGFEPEKITNAIDYERIVKAYMEIEE